MLTRPREPLSDAAQRHKQDISTAALSEGRRSIPANDTRLRLPRIELALWCVALVLFVAFNAAISLDLQPVWLDEVTVADPAVNLYLGKGFTSTGWQYQTKEEFWASNAPLHQILLFHWLKLFKLSPLSVRSMNFVLMAGIILMTWLAVVRMSLVRTWQGRAAMFALLTCTAGLTFNYCAGRYDCIGILLCVTIFFGFSLQKEWQRWGTMVAAATFIPLAGVNLLPYVALMGGMCVAMFGLRYVRELGFVVLGLVIGASFLYMLYATNQVANVILTSAGGHALYDVVDKSAAVRDGNTASKVLYTLTHLPHMLALRLKDLGTWYTHDRSYVLLALFVVGSAVYAFRKRALPRISVLTFGAAAALLVPFGLGLARNYPFYYSWMSLLPLAITAGHLVSRRFEERSVLWERLALGGLLVFACYWGMPQRMVRMHQEAELSGPYQRLDAFLAAQTKPGDCAYADFEPYYGLIARTRYTLLPTYKDMMNETERRELSLIVVRRENADKAQQIVGGEWQKTAELNEPAPYDLVVFRRAHPVAQR